MAESRRGAYIARPHRPHVALAGAGMTRAMIRSMLERSTARRGVAARRTRAVLLALALPGLFAGVAVAQTKPGAPPPRGHAAARGASPKKTTSVDAGAAATVAPGALTAVAAAPPPTAPIVVSDAGGVVESKTLDGGTHVFKFSELDIEGRLKSPQLVYFLRRVRAEFSAGDLGHRTFMREMSETRKESSF
jgi:hypothetical protein